MIYIDNSVGPRDSNSGGFEGTPRRHPQQGTIEALVDKYVNWLGDADTKQPRIVIRDNLGSKWLGRTIFRVREPDTTTIELQKSILEEDATLERVLAHEIIHHIEFMRLSPTDVAKIRIGVKPPSHGQEFLNLAAEVNKHMGEDFVTVTSDHSYVQAKRSKPYYVLVMPWNNGAKFAYAMAVRMTPRAHNYAQHYVNNNAGVLMQTTNPRWANGAKLGEQSGFSIPIAEEDQDELRRMYEQVTRSRAAFESRAR